MPASALPAYTPDLANGKVMFHAGGCASCHATPSQEDKTRLGGGLGLKSPFGTFYAPNISRDPKDGIGGWTERSSSPPWSRARRPTGATTIPAFPYTLVCST